MLEMNLKASEDNYSMERLEREKKMADEKAKKQSYYEKLKEAQAAKYDVDYVDYDTIESTTDDEEYWLRGRGKREWSRWSDWGDLKEDRLTHHETVKAEEKGAIMAIAAIVGILVLFALCKCCYNKVKGNATT